MKILVVGATGKTGELTWRKAVAEGHDVTIFLSVPLRSNTKTTLYAKCKVMC